jgi:hypothetical protein
MFAQLNRDRETGLYFFIYSIIIVPKRYLLIVLAGDFPPFVLKQKVEPKIQAG